MSRHHDFHRSGPDFEDPAFAPRSSFDFEDEGNHFGEGIAAFDTYPAGDMGFHFADGFHDAHDNLDAQFFQDEPDQMAQNPRTNSFAMAANVQEIDPSMSSFPHSAVDVASAQSHIVRSRNGQVRQQYGQITPPDEIVPQPFKTPRAKPTQSQSQSQQSRAQDAGKLSNEQRARIAANTRHSRSKNAKKKQQPKDDDEVESEDESSLKPNNNLNVQREKNRVAAAKCRAKKKSANEQQEEMANQFSTTNNYLTREIRELKNQKSEFQNLLLAHRPGVCECHGIHDYNFGQAQQLVLNVRRQAAEPSPSSPSRDSFLSGPSPVSEESGPMFSRPSPQEALANNAKTQSFNNPMNFAFNQTANPNAFQSEELMGGDRQMHREFAEFLQSSPGGRTGFS